MLKTIQTHLLKMAMLVLALCGASFLNAPALAIGVCSNVTFDTAALVPVNSFPRSVAAGDLDGDGDFDLAVASSNNSSGGFGTISILLNDGAGNFTPGTTLTPSISVQTISIADLNADEIGDIIVGGGNNSGGTNNVGVSVYYGNGNGGYGFPINLATNFFVNALTVADLNRNGLPDIIAATTNGTVLTFNNTGNDFALTNTSSVGNNPRAIVVADFNGDNILDAATANQSGNNVSILYGLPNGSFGVGINVQISSTNSSISPITLAAGDLNNDNRPDLVVAGSSNSSLFVLLNNGNGGFNEGTSLNTQLNSSSIQSVLLGRFFGGSNLDVLVVAAASFSDDPNRVVIYRGNGNGTFNVNQQFTFPTGIAPLNAAVADFNGDGRPDIATANSNSSNLTILLSNSFGGYGAKQTLLSNQPTAMVAGDFNNDGFVDAITSGTNNSTQSLTLYFGDGNGNFITPQNFPAPSGSGFQVTAADLNNDSRLDLITYGTSNFGSSNTVSVYLNNGTNTPFGSPTVPANYTLPGTPAAVAVGDFNRDGRRDLVIALSNSTSLALLLGGPNGTFVTPATSFALNFFPAAVTTGDFNRDGFLDAAAAGIQSGGSNGQFAILYGNGAGIFTQATTPANLSSSAPNSIVSTDFNNDGRLDFAVLSGGSNFSSSTGILSVLFGTVDGGYGTPVNYTVGVNSRGLRLGDFNGDSRPDLAFANRNSNTVGIIFNNGNGSFSQVQNYLSGVLPNAIEIADINRDGKADILSANQIGATTAVSPNTIPGTLSVLFNGCKEAITKTDYNADGRTDFAVFRPSNNTWYVTSNGVNFTQQQFGASGDVPVQGDYDGDGETDFAVFRPSNSTWYILRSTTNRLRAVQWGASGDIPVVGDYDADGRADVAVFRPSNSTWYILPSSSPAQFQSRQFGQTGDVPLPADYDGDGRSDLAVFRAGTWVILNSSNNQTRTQAFGLSGDVPVPGDYDADGRTDLAVFRGGIWYILLSATNQFRAEQFGLASDRVQPGDYDGDGRTDIAVFRDGTWYVRQSSNDAFRALAFGTTGDIPVASVLKLQ